MRYATVPKSWVSAVGHWYSPSTTVLGVSKPNQFTPLRVVGLPSVPNNCPFKAESGTYNQHDTVSRPLQVRVGRLASMLSLHG